SRATAASRRLTVAGAYPRCSRWMRYRSTTVRVNAGRGSEQYQATNSRIAWSYVRWPLAEVKLLSTAAFDCSRSGRARTRFGGFLRRGLVVNLRMSDGLQSVAGSFRQVCHFGVKGSGPRLM